MRKKSTTTLKIAVEESYNHYGKEQCKYIHLNVNPDLTDDDVLLAGQTLGGLQAFPVHSIERLDTCDWAE